MSHDGRSHAPERRSAAATFAIPVLAALVGGHQLALRGFPQGHDWIYELARIVEYEQALLDGQLPPSWAPDLYRGFGSPVFLFYAPLFVGICSLLTLSGLAVTTAAVAVLLAFSCLAAIGTVLLAREIAGGEDPGTNAAARIAGVAYVLSPYLLTDVLIRNACAEFLALCLAPFPLWGAVRLVRRRRHGGLVLAFSLALLVIAHNLSALVMAAALGTWAAALLWRREDRDRGRAMVLCIVAALGLSAWFWLPALAMKGSVRVDEMVVGKFDVQQNFQPVAEMFGFGTFPPVGWLLPLVLVLGARVLARGKREQATTALLAALVVLIGLQTPASAPLWERIPLLPLFQFPWRLMGPSSLVGSLLLGTLWRSAGPKHVGWEVLLVGLLAANALPVMSLYRPLPEGIAASVSPQSIRTRGIPVTVGDEYLPRTAEKSLSRTVPPDRSVLGGRGEVRRVFEAEGTDLWLETASDAPFDLQLARWFFPGWKAESSGRRLDVFGDDLGALRIRVPPGSREVRVRRTQTGWRRVGLIVSGLALFAGMAAIWIGSSRKKASARNRSPRQNDRGAPHG